MSLSAYALVTVPELKNQLGTPGSGKDGLIESCINQASSMIETRLGRQIVSRGDLTEYHTFTRADSQLQLGEWPAATVASVYEDVNRAYTSPTLLVVDTDYIISKPTGRLLRVNLGAGQRIWQTGFRAIKVTYAAGFRSASTGLPAGAIALPDDLKEACMFVAASIYKEADRQNQGVSSISDAAGTTTRFLGYFTPAIMGILDTQKRYEWGKTWERDA